MRQPKNSVLSEKLSSALEKGSSTLTGKPRKSSQLVEREAAIRKRFGHRHHSTETTVEAPEALGTPTLVAVLDAPEIETIPSPSHAEIAAVLESAQRSVESPNAPAPPAPTATPESLDEPQSDPSTPFSPHISAMLARLRDARNIVVFDLEQTNKRLEKYQEALRIAQRDVDSTEMSALTLTDSLEKIDKNIEECKHLDAMSAEIASLLPHGHAKAHAPTVRAYTKPDANDQTVCRRADVLATIKNGPTRNWSAKEVIAALPAIKRHHAKASVPAILAGLAVEGKISRVTTGVYTLACNTAVQ